MSWLLSLRHGSPRLTRLPPEATSPAPEPRARPDLSALNAGQGDARSRIRPNVKHAETPSILFTEHGPLASPSDWLASDMTSRAVILMPADNPLSLQDGLSRLDRIVLETPAIGDGRTYSNAVLIRKRLQWRGPLRLVGQVLVDQIWAFARCGVDEFALRADQDPHRAVAALTAYSSTYQWSVGDTPAHEAAEDAA